MSIFDTPEIQQVLKEAWKSQIAKEETPGTRVGGVVHSLGSITYVGEPGPERVTLPEGAKVAPLLPAVEQLALAFTAYRRETDERIAALEAQIAKWLNS